MDVEVTVLICSMADIAWATAGLEKADSFGGESAGAVG